MWWHKNKQPETNESDAQLRAQLIEACKNVRHQIEVQKAVTFSVRGGNDGDAIAIEALETELVQLEDALANLGPDDA